MIIPNQRVHSESNQAVRLILKGNKQVPRISSFLDQQFVAGRAKGDQVVGVVVAASSTRNAWCCIPDHGTTPHCQNTPGTSFSAKEEDHEMSRLPGAYVRG